ncbi:MAG: molybdopterin adenylyltransferase [archaeon]|jgi:molybdopterin adenylyltransferase|nr:molybdopterin adenylyltransferase [archaeon]
MQRITEWSGSAEHVGDHAVFGIVTVSDRASQGTYEDEGGPAILSFFQEAIKSPWTTHYRCVPDEQEAVEAALIELSDQERCSVVVTTGGTGPAARDITPEATEAVCDRMMPGFGEQMRSISLAFVPTAILSRQVGGLRGSSLIFNLPGRPKAIRETIDEIWRAVPYCVDLMGGPYMDMSEDVCNAFRPKSARR